MGYNVAIDGPAGAGKSTIAKLVAKEKGYIYVDTGAMYRGLAVHFLKKGLSGDDKKAVIDACDDAKVTIGYENVRAKLLELQRSLAREKDVIMDGRDIGTNILPDADVKIYLTASVETRAKRRYEELSAKGEHITLEKIMTDIKERDHRDMTREVAPLKQAEDAILVDSSNMTIDEVVRTICDHCR